MNSVDFEALAEAPYKSDANKDSIADNFDSRDNLDHKDLKKRDSTETHHVKNGLEWNDEHQARQIHYATSREIRRDLSPRDQSRDRISSDRNRDCTSRDYRRSSERSSIYYGDQNSHYDKPGYARERSYYENSYYPNRDSYVVSKRSRDSRGSSRDRDTRTTKRHHNLIEEERDMRTIFVQQLAARLRTRQLKEFFERAGPVREAQIVKDRISGYVEFIDESSMQNALEMTGTKLLGIPVIIQYTEAEKNRQAREAAALSNEKSEPKYHRIQLGNIYHSIGEDDLRQIFEPFGEIEIVRLSKDPANQRSRGTGYIQFRDVDSAKEAYKTMNGFDLAGRPIRVTLGSDWNMDIRSSKELLGPDMKIHDQKYSDKGSHKNSTYVSREELMAKLARDPVPPEGKSTVLASRETGENWISELEEDVRIECDEKYGKIVFIRVDENSEGELYVKFATEVGAKRAVEGLNGRWFGGRTVKASFCADSLFYAKCPKARDL